VFPLAGRPAFEFVIYLVTDPARLINGFLHRENEAWDGLIGQVIQTDFLQRNGAYPVSAAGFAEIRMAFPGVDQYHGDFGGVAVALSDHF
jgi:hypothetical protein